MANIHQSLLNLENKYRSSNPKFSDCKGKIKHLYQRFVLHRETALIDAAATAASLSMFMMDGFDYSKVTPEMQEAWSLAFPSTSMNVLENASPEQMSGYLNVWKGKLFEVELRDSLNNGEWVGDIHLDPGQEAVLANSPTQPGWDLQILDDDGNVVDVLQAKATNSLSYVKDALERYPDIDIVTTSEVLQNGSDQIFTHIHGSSITDAQLQKAIESPLQELTDSSFVNFLESVAPFLPFAVILFTEGRHVLIGKKSYEQALISGSDRIIKTGVSLAAGAFVYWLDGGLLSLPATILTRLGIDRINIMKITIETIENRIQQLEPISNRYRGILQSG